MKDAYSFDVEEAGAEKTYKDMYDAYVNIFRRCGFRFGVVEADSGQIGGNFSHEFMVLADTGEDTIISCDTCDYAANLERAEVGVVEKSTKKEKGRFKRVPTPGAKKIEEVAAFLGITADRLLKTMIYNSDKGIIGVLVRGDREINETKLKNLLNLDFVELASESVIEETTGGPLGFSGPMGLKIPIYADRDVMFMEDFVVGGNEGDVHIIDVNIDDFSAKGFYDIKVAIAGDKCPRCSGILTSTRGIEVGHIFKLGLKYSKAMNATYLDKEGKEQFIVMGCYGIGVGRTVAAAIEQGNDENGMVLPAAIAPFEVNVLPVNTSHAESMELAHAVYKELLDRGIDALLDDRDERPGVKFKDCDLIGIPLRVTIGERNLKEGLVEIKLRNEKESQKIPKENIVEKVVDHVQKLKHL
jgi:prolyl-tRNA synthetase